MGGPLSFRGSPLRWLPLLLLSLTVAAWAASPTKRLSDEARGELLYDRHCVQCHGTTTAGHGPAAEALVAEVPDLRGKITRETRDAQAKLVLEGRGAMPSFDLSFDRYDARRILRHMERLAKKGDAPEEPDTAQPDPEPVEDGPDGGEP